MDQDTFADISANVARMSNQLAQLHRDVAELARAGQRIYQHLALHDESWENRSEWEAWAESLGDIAGRTILVVSPPQEPPDPEGTPIRLWTRWNFDTMATDVAPGPVYCYKAWLTMDERGRVYANVGNDEYEPDWETIKRDPACIDATTWWCGEPGTPRDHAIEEIAAEVGWTRRANDGETDETY